MGLVAEPTVGSQLITEFGPLGGTAASFAFSSIPGTYRALRLMLVGRGDTAATSTVVNVTINGDGGSNYDRQTLQGTASTASASAVAAATTEQIGSIAASTAVASATGQIIVDIPLYAGTTFRKSMICTVSLKTADSNVGMFVARVDLHWRSTAAITAITLTPGAGNFAAGSWCVLYGIS